MNRPIFSLKSISLVAILLFSASGPLYGQARIWDGSTDNDWDDGTNWTPANIPNTTGEFAFFSGLTPGTIDLSDGAPATNITTAGILFNTTSNYTINPGGNAANSLTFDSTLGFLGGLPFIITINTGAQTVNADMILNETLIAANLASANLTLAGDISGAGGLTAINVTPAILSGNNSYAGTTSVLAGTVILNSSGTAVPGSLTLGDGVGGAGADIVQLSASDQIANTSAVTIASSGRLDLNNFNDTIGSLASASATSQVFLGSGTLTASDATSTTFAGVISETGNLIKQGAGTLTLSNANTYTGTTTVSAGTLEIQNATGLGTAASGTTVQSGASLELALPAGFNGIAESITLNGTGAGATGALINTSGANILTGTTTIASDSLVVDGAAAALIFVGNVNLGANTLTIQENNVGGTFVGSVISGSGGIVKTGAGTWFMNGTASNTYTGDTTVNAGTMSLGKTAGLDAISGANINLNAGTLLLAADNQIANATNMNLNGGTFSTAGFDESLATLTLNATSTIDVGAGGSIINYTSGTYSAGQLNVTSWAGSFSGGGSDQIIFGSSLTQTFLDNVVWTDQGITGAFQLPSGEIVPIPEPATIFSGALLIGLIGIDFYRRRKKSKGSELIDPES